MSTHPHPRLQFARLRIVYCDLSLPAMMSQAFLCLQKMLCAVHQLNGQLAFRCGMVRAMASVASL